MARRIRFPRSRALAAAAILVVAILSVALVYRQRPPVLHVQSGFEMGTFVEIRAYGGKKAEDAISRGFERLREIERLMSTSIPESGIAKLNTAQPRTPVRVHPDTIHVVSAAIAYAQKTGGAFDPTVGKLVELWAIGSGNETVPTSDEIRDALLGVGYENLVVDSTQSRITRLTDLRLDLGAIAKGYASDEIVELLVAENISGGVVDLGGNIRVFGRNPLRKQWRIGIQDPFRPRGSYIGTVDISSGAVATSGDYERYFVADGVRYHHILDPESGYPASPQLKSVTVVAETGIEADALSTGLFVLGLDEMFDFIENVPSVGVIAITADRRVIVSSGVAHAFVKASEDFEYEIR